MWTSPTQCNHCTKNTNRGLSGGWSILVWKLRATWLIQRRVSWQRTSASVYRSYLLRFYQVIIVHHYLLRILRMKAPPPGGWGRAGIWEPDVAAASHGQAHCFPHLRKTCGSVMAVLHRISGEDWTPPCTEAPPLATGAVLGKGRRKLGHLFPFKMTIILPDVSSSELLGLIQWVETGTVTSLSDSGIQALKA